MTTVTAAPVTFTVDPWDPGYGLAFSEDLDGGALGESSAELNLDLEIPCPPVAPHRSQSSIPPAWHGAVLGWCAPHRRTGLGARQ